MKKNNDTRLQKLETQIPQANREPVKVLSDEMHERALNTLADTLGITRAELEIKFQELHEDIKNL